MRHSTAAGLLIFLASIAVFAQTIRQEKTIKLPNGVSVTSASVSRTGRLVAGSCSDNTVRVWVIGSGELVRTLDSPREAATDLEFSNDGRLLAIAYERGAIKVWDADSWKVQEEVPAPMASYVLAISSDNRLLAAAGDYDAQVWDLTAHKSMAKLPAPFGWSWALSFSPDSTLIATADGDTFVRVYDAHTGALRNVAENFLLEPLAVAFSADGKSLFAGGIDKTISIIDAASGKFVRSFPKQSAMLWSLVVSPDGKQAAAAYRSAEHFSSVNQLLMWDLATQTVRANFQKPGVEVIGGAFVGDRFLVAGSKESELSIWSIQ